MPKKLLIFQWLPTTIVLKIYIILCSTQLYLGSTNPRGLILELLCSSSITRGIEFIITNVRKLKSILHPLYLLSYCLHL